MCYHIQKQPLTGTLERRCFEIRIQNTWQMPAGGFVFRRVQATSLQPQRKRIFHECFSIILTADFILQHLVHLFSRAPFFQSSFSGCFGIFLSQQRVADLAKNHYYLFFLFALLHRKQSSWHVLLFSILMVIQAYCLKFFKLKLQRHIQNPVEYLRWSSLQK